MWKGAELLPRGQIDRFEKFTRPSAWTNMAFVTSAIQLFLNVFCEKKSPLGETSGFPLYSQRGDHDALISRTFWGSLKMFVNSL